MSLGALWDQSKSAVADLAEVASRSWRDVVADDVLARQEFEKSGELTREGLREFFDEGASRSATGNVVAGAALGLGAAASFVFPSGRGARVAGSGKGVARRAAAGVGDAFAGEGGRAIRPSDAGADVVAEMLREAVRPGSGLDAGPLVGRSGEPARLLDDVSVDDFERAITEVRKIEFTRPGEPTRSLGETVYQYPTEEYGPMGRYLSDDGLSGFAIKPDGDLVSVFSAPGLGRGGALVDAAVARGARKLDAFDEDGFLPQLYGSRGFVEVKREPWDPAQKPDNWRGGEPDVVYMELPAGGSPARTAPSGAELLNPSEASPGLVSRPDALSRGLQDAPKGIFSRVSAEESPIIRQSIIDMSRRVENDPLSNRIFATDFANDLDSSLNFVPLIKEYANLPKGGNMPVPVSRGRGDLAAFMGKKPKGADSPIFGNKDIFQSPLVRAGAKINTDFIESERALHQYALNFTEATSSAGRKKARLDFVEEWARTLSNQARLMSNNSRGNPDFYVKRADAVLSIAKATGFPPHVIAIASSAASQQAPPMEEMFRLLMAAPFVVMKNGRAVFDEQAYRKAVVWGGKTKQNSFSEIAGRAMADAINNPNYLDHAVPGIAHKTTPYSILALDALNPYAVVADSNYHYMLSGTSALGSWVKPVRGKTAQAPRLLRSQMSMGVSGSVTPAAQTRALGDAVGGLGSTVQADTWFNLRPLTQTDVPESFAVTGETSGIRTLFTSSIDRVQEGTSDAIPEMLAVIRRISGATETSWEQAGIDAMRLAGRHNSSNDDLVRLANKNYAKFLSESQSSPDLWQVINREGFDIVVPSRSNWRATIGYSEIYTDGGKLSKKFLTSERINNILSEQIMPLIGDVLGSSGTSNFAVVGGAILMLTSLGATRSQAKTALLGEGVSREDLDEAIREIESYGGGESSA